MKKLFLLVTMLLLSSGVIHAHDIEVDGIFYNVISGNQVEVTYQGDSVNANPNRYEGFVSIPASITYNDTVYNVIGIGKFAFQKCHGLTSVAMPTKLKNIGAQAFAFCSSLTSITIPKGVKSVERGTFIECNNLTSVLIPKGVESIGELAFYKCINLTSITLPKGVRSVEQGAFWQCCGLTSIVLPKGLESIGELAFCKCSNLTSVSIPNGVRSIGPSAFRDCSGLASVVIPKSVKSIERLTFGRCGNLSSIVIPKGVDSIGELAFYGCINLASVSIPNGVKSIANRAFDSCNSLASIAIPKSVTGIGKYAFYGCKSLISVEIPEGVKSVGEGSFYKCDSLISVVIPETVTSIELGTFKDCSSLTSVSMPKNLTSIGVLAFDSCGKLNSVVIPECVESIGDYAFRECSNLTSIDLPESLKSIGRHAFSDCFNLADIAIPGSVSSIGEYAFSGTSWYNKLSEGVIYVGKVLYCYKGTMPQDTSITVKDGTLGIAGCAFEKCTGLKSITIPNSLTSIGNSAFHDCRYLSEVHIGSIEAWCQISFNDVYSNPLFRARNLILNGRPVSDLTIPEGVRSIGDYAFVCCDVTSVVVPQSMTSIGGDAFYNCRNLAKVSISSIDNWCNISFRNAKSNPLYYAHDLFLNGKLVKDLVIPHTVQSIGNYAFTSSSLTSVAIPKGVVSVGEGAFEECINLSSIVIPEGVIELGDKAFYGCSSLASVVIPESVRNIGNSSFYDCYSLTNVVIPEGVDSIGDFAFSGYCGLSTIMLPKTLKRIGEKAFCNYTGVNKIYCYSTTLPHVEDEVFNAYFNKNVTLYVPACVIQDYKSTSPWSDFGRIEEIENVGYEVGYNQLDDKGGFRMGAFAVSFMDKVDNVLNRKILFDRSLVWGRERIKLKEIVDWSFVWEWLPQLKLRDSYVVECYKDGDMDFRYGMNVLNKERMGEYISRGLLSAETTMFLTEEELPLNDKCSWDSIWNHIEVPFTEEGLWQAFLLDELWRMLPLGWHWAYHKDTYLLKFGDLDSVWKDAAEFTLLEIEELEEPWKSRMLEDMHHQQKVKDKLKKEEHLLLPHIEIDEKRHHAIIHYTYWSDWEGVVAVKLPVSYVDGLIVWGDREKTVLLPYDCGVLY